MSLRKFSPKRRCRLHNNRRDELYESLTKDEIGDWRRSSLRKEVGKGNEYGVFDTAFGVAWFAGSAAMGLLYDKSVLAVVIFSVALQLAALPVFVLARRAAK